MNPRVNFNYPLIILLVFMFLPFGVFADGSHPHLSKGEVIYVPAYSHIYIGNREQPFLLTITISIRNIDPKNQITITTVDYYETQGKLLRKYLKEPVTLQPLESLRYVVPENDKSGGSGANFIVEWKSEQVTNPPIAETIMIGTKSAQGISFVSRGRVVYQTK